MDIDGIDIDDPEQPQRTEDLITLELQRNMAMIDMHGGEA